MMNQDVESEKKVEIVVLGSAAELTQGGDAERSEGKSDAARGK